MQTEQVSSKSLKRTKTILVYNFDSIDVQNDVNFVHVLLMIQCFFAPGLKGPPGASSVWIFHLSVRPSVHNSVPLINNVQFLKFGLSCSNQTWTVSSSKDCSHFTDITCPWDGVGSKLRTYRFLP